MAGVEARGRGIELMDKQLPISAIVRSPCVALRYRMDDNQVRLNTQVFIGTH